MRHTPPESLVELLSQLGLAAAKDFRAVATRARRLARGLPLFESVWVDALAQAGFLTAFQASEINARRGSQLQVGPYVLECPQGSLQYADWYTARKIDTGDRVLLVAQDVSAKSQQDRDEILCRLEKLVTDSAVLDSSAGNLLPVVAADVDASRAWAVCRADKDFIATGQTAGEWLIHNGRFPPSAVGEIARSMTAALNELQQSGLPHGDIRAETLLLTASGRVLLPYPGLRAAFRPTESHATAKLPPQAYDGLAPERSARATTANLTSDIYASGCLWWHLLTARSALPGGNGLAKMRSAQTLDIPAVKPLAPDTPPELAAAIEACVARNPDARPQSYEQLAQILDTDDRKSPHARSRSLGRALGNIHGISQSPAFGLRSIDVRQNVGVLAAVTVAAALVFAAVWLALPGEPAAQIIIAPSSSAAGEASKKLSDTSLPTEAKPITSPQPALDIQPSEKFTGPHPGKQLPGTQLPAEQTSEKQLLDSDKPVVAESLRFHAGQTVCAKGSGRACLLVPRGGLVVDVADVSFENIDFRWKQDTDDKPASQAGALIDLRAAGVKFHGCTFSCPQESNALPVAIRWTHPLDPSSAELSLPSGSIHLRNCVFTTVSAAIDCHTAAALTIEVDNVLHLGNGPLVRLDRVPRSDEPLSLSLVATTLRDSGPLLQYPSGPIQTRPARLLIDATASVFMPTAETGLIRFVGRSSPQSLLGRIEWTGQGSLVSQKTPIAQWLDAPGPDSASETLDDTAIAMAGLVRGKVEFAAPAATGIAASQITQWQAPLQSPQRPGVDVTLLPKK